MTETLTDLRQRIADYHLIDEDTLVERLVSTADLSPDQRRNISDSAAALVQAVRDESDPSMMESFLAEFGLSTQEGVALMCLAEALLRVPDNETIDDLIRDKITPHDWGAHVGDSGSILVNASTWALMLTGKVLADEAPGVVGALRGVVRRLGEPVVRTAVRRAMQEMGEQFVLGETIAEATRRGNALVGKGYSYSYDMLGEAARTFADADRYFEAYADAIAALGERATSDDIARNPGISVKLSALHPRYEYTQRDRTLAPLTDRVLDLARRAKQSRLGFNIDAEEANRLELSLDIIERVLADPSLAGWHGFGVVVQAYGRRALPVIDWLHALAEQLDRQIMVRLVKGAYWDTEIKQAQVLGLESYPVLTRKINTDVSYIACAKRLLDMRGRIYPQFATHNAHTMAAVLEFAGPDGESFEFQRLHGMGEALHEAVRERYSVRSRIYAPVGAHEDLLAYLVRRLLENGANSSFVNQIVDESISPASIAADPLNEIAERPTQINRDIPPPTSLFGNARRNSRGFDPNDAATLAAIRAARHAWLAPHVWEFPANGADLQTVMNPTTSDETVGRIGLTPLDGADALVATATAAAVNWSATPVRERADCLRRAADLFEQAHGEIFALVGREAGKTIADAIAELREAVDFLRYYASEAETKPPAGRPRGAIVCISPWNFPLAIFTGQVAAALVTGNAVIAKPAEQSPLIAARAVQLLHAAGIPADVLQLAVGDGQLGAALTRSQNIGGVCFTGSTEVARLIERSLAEHNSPNAMLIAETGGLNAMIVDTTALNEQAVTDIVASAFQSAGQRCSALRVLYVQKERADSLLEMLAGAMDALTPGDPLNAVTDVGPLIDAEAEADVGGYIERQKAAGRLRRQIDVPDGGHFVGPALVDVDSIDDVEREVFGPVLHVVRFDADDVDAVLAAINARGFGLTLGLHTRIDERVQRIVNRAKVGNVYVNRNQIGAIVGSQPFGGEGLSGTGPKAGGPHYLARFVDRGPGDVTTDEAAVEFEAAALNAAFDHPATEAWANRTDRLTRLDALAGPNAQTLLDEVEKLGPSPADLPGPTGESNRLSRVPIGRVLCVNSAPADLRAHVIQALAGGNTVVAVAPDAAPTLADLVRPDVPLAALNGQIDSDVVHSTDLDAVATAAPNAEQLALRRALAGRDGPIVRFIDEAVSPARFVHERAVCIDTTAAGGNAELLAANS
ncbi:MAG: bifunctional proline dehydrogenase/L-glutamate gamma-semialdehyde dehydrogenase PutA [Pseudomonadota bacterium]